MTAGPTSTWARTHEAGEPHAAGRCSSQALFVLTFDLDGVAGGFSSCRPSPLAHPIRPCHMTSHDDVPMHWRLPLRLCHHSPRHAPINRSSPPASKPASQQASRSWLTRPSRLDTASTAVDAAWPRVRQWSRDPPSLLGARAEGRDASSCRRLSVAVPCMLVVDNDIVGTCRRNRVDYPGEE